MTIRGLWRYFPILCVGLGFFPAWAQLLDPTNFHVPVTSRNTTAVTIAAGNDNGQIAMVADPVVAGGDMFDMLTDNAAAVVSLVLPGGTQVTADNAVNLGFIYVKFTNAAPVNNLVPSPVNQAGTHISFILPPSQIPGTYTVKVNAAAALTPVVVIASFYTSSPVTSGVTTSAGTYKVGDTVIITGLAFNGGTPITDATVTARILDAANLTADPPVIPLVDFGPYDSAAGDGLYTGSYTAASAGNFLVVVRTTGSAPSGNYSRTATAAFNVVQPRASFASFSDAGVDDDANGKPDRIVVNALVNVLQAGSYQFGVTLLAGNGTIVKASGIADLALGSQTIPAVFSARSIVSGLGVDGPYTLRDAILVHLDDIDNPMVDYRSNAGSTAAYSLSSLDLGSLYFTGQNTVAGLDTNSDGKFDILRVQATAMVSTAGTYQWSASLVNSAGIGITFYNTSASLAAGSNNITFDFSGSAIGQSCSTGVYSVRSVLLFGPAGSVAADHLLDTPSFTAAQFADTACFPVSVTPASSLVVAGTAQTFTFSYSDAGGSSNLAQVNMLINSSSALASSCSVSWVRSDHSIRLYNDGGDGSYGYGTDTGFYSFAVGFANSQCALSFNNPIVESGNGLTMTLSIKFTPAFAGPKVIYMSAQEAAGPSSALQLMGSSTITTGSPCDVNGDASTNTSDAQAVIDEALGKVHATHDLNRDGSVNITDVQKVLNAALGNGCIP